MTDRELRKLRRTDLLELLLAQEKENEDLRRQIQQLQDRLEERELKIINAGSIAEASMQLNGVFEAAQSAADQYLASIRKMNEEKENYCSKIEEEARLRAEQTLRETEARCSRMEEESRAEADRILKETEEKQRAMLEETKKDLKSYWASVSLRMEELYKKQLGEKEQEPENEEGNVSG